MDDYIPQERGEGLRTGREIEFKEIRDYLCGNIRVEFYSYDGFLEVKTNMECELVNHVDDYLRIHFHFGTKTKPYFRSDDVPLDSYDAQNVTFTQNYHNE